MARALIAANADRIIWGPIGRIRIPSRRPDSKPTELTPLYQIDDGRLLNQLAVWAPDAAIRNRILVDNPAQALWILRIRSPTPHALCGVIPAS